MAFKTRLHQNLQRNMPVAIEICSAEGQPGRACKMEKFTLSGAPHRRKARRHQETAQTAREGGDYWNSREADAGRREEKAREASKVIFNSAGGRKGPCGQA